MRQVLAVGVLVLLVWVEGARAAIEAPFEAAYFVESFGSMTPVRGFHIDGPAPWLFVDLGTPRGQYSYASSRWFSEYESGARFSTNEGTLFSSERWYWLSPSAADWEANKGVGAWQVDVSYAWWTLAMTYGVGAPLTNSRGSETVSFSVVGHAIPEPGGLSIGLSAAALGMIRLRGTRARRAAEGQLELGSVG